MGIEWKHDHSRGPRQKMVRVVIPSVGEPLHIVIGRNPIHWRTVGMHYDTQLNREVPCLASACKYCPQPVREVTYIPVLLARGNAPGGRFAPRIVPVTDGWCEILDAPDHELSIYKVTRHSKNASCRWVVATSLATYGLSPYEGQPIEASLRRMWGVKEE